MGKLKDEIKQTRPFQSVEQEAYLNLLRTADALSRQVAEVLKPYGLSPTQYNILRILRGAGPEGLSCQECSNRMITRDPDTTRLFDRLESRDLIQRQRSTRDRRVVMTFITEQGRQLLATLDQTMLDLDQRLLGHLGHDNLLTLIHLLEQAREARA